MFSSSILTLVRMEVAVKLIVIQTGQDGDVEGWNPGNPVLVRGPYEYTTAIILKMNSGDGTVKFSMAMEMFVRIKPIEREGRYVHGNLGAW